MISNTRLHRGHVFVGTGVLLLGATLSFANGSTIFTAAFVLAALTFYQFNHQYLRKISAFATVIRMLPIPETLEKDLIDRFESQNEISTIAPLVQVRRDSPDTENDVQIALNLIDDMRETRPLARYFSGMFFAMVILCTPLFFNGT